MLRTISVLSLLAMFCTIECQMRRRQNHQIDWTSSNTVFKSNRPAMTVRLGDTLDFLCPHYNQTTATSSMEYNTVYLVSEIDFNLCFTENYQPLIRCDQPIGSKGLVYTLSISKYLPYPNMPEFVDGQSYYFISTSNGERSGIDQKFDGLCREKNLRLIVDVQKYYRRYSILDYTQAQSKQLKQRISQSFESLLISKSDRCQTSLIVIAFSTFISFVIRLNFIQSTIL